MQKFRRKESRRSRRRRWNPSMHTSEDLLQSLLIERKRETHEGREERGGGRVQINPGNENTMKL